MDQKVYLKFTTLTTPLPDFIYEKLQMYSRNANNYHPQPKELTAKISTRYNLHEEMIYLTAGTDEAIYLFGLAFGKSVYAFTPTYITYDEIRAVGANIHLVNALENNEYHIPTQAIPDAALIFVANPNNPFGFTAREKIIELIENNSHAIVVIDEVYAEFADLSVIDLTTKYQNLAVIRSFSKSFGMAGNRVAYVVANPAILQKIRPKTQWASLSYLSAGAAITALDHEDYFLNLINEVSQRREKFQTFLQDNGFSILPTKINAALIKFPSEEDGTRFFNYLDENNFVTSHGNGESNIGLDKSFVRISIGTEEEMQQLQEVISKFT
jgi:histidinol-phosphate aminotransferase